MTCTTFDLTPSCVNLDLYAGDANSFAVEIIDDGTIANLTGWTFKAEARKTKADATAAISATCTITDAAAGIVTVSWGDCRTLLAGAEKWEGVWDFQFVKQGGTLPRTPIAGKMTVILDVTRP